jgi:uncharacterized protein YfiM (DUF2279 family)
MKRWLFVAFSFHALSSTPDPWFGPDKVKHFFLGAFVQSAGFAAFQTAGARRMVSFAGASAVTTSAAAAKELHDRRTAAGDPSLRDFAWSVVGAAAVSPLLLKAK